MEIKALNEYEQVLYGCRFCPMCKPAAEVGNLTQLESHSTRGRALLLWRAAKGVAELGNREAELLYQSTLDSISEAWCINHYPVSGYMAAARRELVSKGLVPDSVRETLEREPLESDCPKANTVLLAGEVSELSEKNAAEPAVKLLERSGEKAPVFTTPTGVLAFTLGDVEKAREQAGKVAETLKSCGVKRVIADGPQTLFALKVLYPLLSVELSAALTVQSLTEVTEKAVAAKKVKTSLDGSQKVFFQDSRSAVYLADELAADDVLQPGRSETEQHSGSGEVYELPRRILKNLGITCVSSVWSRSLSRSSGADDGLWLTYPDLAAGLAKVRLEHARKLGAEVVVSDSLLDAAILRRAQNNGDGEKVTPQLKIYWLPEIISG